MNKKSQNRNVIVVVSIIALIVVLGIVSLLYVRAEQEKNHLSAQLELGNRYMSELNYEQAIATYEAIIKIDPRCVDAYIAIAEAYVAMGDIETAEAILKQGYSLVNDEKIGEQLNKLQDTKGHNELEQTSEEKVVSTAEQRDDRFKARIVDGIYQREYYYYNLDKEDELAIENIISLGMEERIDEIHSVCVDGKLREILNNYSRNSGIQQIFIAFRDIKVSFYYSDQYDSEHFRISAIPLEEGKGFVYEVARTGEGDSLWMRTDYVLGECKEGMFNGEFKQETEVFTTGFFMSEVLAGNAVNGLRTGEVTRSSTTISDGMAYASESVACYENGKPVVFEFYEYEGSISAYFGYTLNEDGNYRHMYDSVTVLSEEHVDKICFNILGDLNDLTKQAPLTLYDENGSFVQGYQCYPF